MTLEELVRKWPDICATQEAIIDFAKVAAEILAEAGRASERSTGDPANFAVRQWADVIRDEALRILREERDARMDKKRVQQLGVQRRLRHGDQRNAGSLVGRKD